MTSRDDDEPEFNACSCGRKLVIVNGQPRHLEDWLAARPRDDDL